ncbi:MAG: hypothetical protein LBS01_07205 [Prevotellaceae bacterium]|jgi:hypothetical protein|nr:hypothetical protein [Prevotellaceae bacterium]
MKNLIKFSAVILCTAIVFAGCKKEEPKEDYASKIVGEYVGPIKADETVLAESATITITRTGDNKVVLALNETIAQMPLDVKCEATVAKSGSDYAVNGETTATVGENVLPVTIAGNITEAGKAVLDINIPGMAVQFTGDKK